jgi:gliding motility-associated-like protein
VFGDFHDTTWRGQAIAGLCNFNSLILKRQTFTNMNRVLANNLLVFLFFLYPSVNYASHIVGGEMTYRYLYKNPTTQMLTYQMTLRVYRDIFSDNGNGATTPFDYYAFTVVSKQLSTGGYVRVKTQAIDVTTERNLPRPIIPCSETPKNVGSAEAVYSWTLELPEINTSYTVSYARCCRNVTISNLIQPSNIYGAIYSVEITPEAQRQGNSSPVFKNFPPPFICAGEPIQFDHSATDADNDQIVYRFANAYGWRDNRANPSIALPPFDIVPYRAPYAVNAPMKGNPLIKIDANTGAITGTPDALQSLHGENYQQFVVTVCAEEYRNGQIIGKIYRDFQFNVVTCKRLVVAALVADSTAGKSFFINSCQSTFKLNNQSYDRANIPNFRWEFLVNRDTIRYQDWSPTLNFDKGGVYNGKLLLNPGSSCSDTGYVTVKVGGGIRTAFTIKYDTCVAGDVVFKSTTTSATTLKYTVWDFGDNTRDSNKIDVTHLYATSGYKNVKLTAKDIYDCVSDTAIGFNWQPAPPILIIEPDNFTSCVPAKIRFVNKSTPIDMSYKIAWDFGDGTFSQDISPMHIFAKADTFTIKLKITSPIGCYKESEFRSWIKVKSVPKADFDWTPKVLNNLKPQVTFVDKSTSDVRIWRWFFSEKAASSEQNPRFSYRDTGIQQVKLYVLNENGCKDSVVKKLYIEPEMTFHIPTAFSPNFDSVNDEFKGTGFLFGMKAFRLSIWNRWGEKIFETNDPTEGWNGAKNNAGKPEPEGVYLYEVEWTTPKNEVKNKRDFLTLFR